MTKAERWLREAEAHGYISLQHDVFLNTRDQLQYEQADLHDGHPYKHFDFSAAKYWITTWHCGKPVGIDGPETLEDVLLIQNNISDVDIVEGKFASVAGPNSRSCWLIDGPDIQELADNVVGGPATMLQRGIAGFGIVLRGLRYVPAVFLSETGAIEYLHSILPQSNKRLGDYGRCG